MHKRACLAFDSRGNPQAGDPEFAGSYPMHGYQSCGNKNSRGFTVLELLIVVAAIVTVAAIAIPKLMSSIEQARIAKAVGDIRNLEEEIALYNTINDQLPADLSQIGFGGYLDPWHNPYQYLNHANLHGNGQARKDRFLVPLNSDYDLYSMGKDGQSAPPITSSKSQDDIIRVGSSGYIGLASQF
jgi:general secretion pathway protein G